MKLHQIDMFTCDAVNKQKKCSGRKTSFLKYFHA